MAEMPQLVVLHVSPWSERARWALDHHGIAHREIEHSPFLGERRLRRLLRQREGIATVPVLVDGDRVVPQSWDIAQHADRVGAGAPLFPPSQQGEIRAWTQRIDRACESARALVVAALLRSPAALDESLPAAIPRWLRPASRPITRYGTRWFARKYGLRLQATTEHEAALTEGLELLRQRKGDAPYVLPAFSYADIVGATMLQSIAPVADEYLELGPATRAVWSRPALADRYADLLAWRDEIYRTHRRARAA
jgi:glutathione S-transferase